MPRLAGWVRAVVEVAAEEAAERVADDHRVSRAARRQPHGAVA
jgi:hypothetical protein